MTQLKADADLRQHLVDLLDGGNAHIRFDDAVKEFPAERTGIRPDKLPHSAWELLEHLRIAQADILAFSLGEDYRGLTWPDDYWPSSQGPTNGAEWEASVKAVHRDLAKFLELLRDERQNLFEPFSWGNGQTLLREALLIADHNSYHIGQIVLVRQMVE